MSALGSVVRSGVGRRRVQTTVITLVVMIAVTAAVLGGTLIVVSNAPFDRAFGQQRGSHLTAQFDASVAPAQLTASAGAPGVTAAAGPFGTASVALVDDRGRQLPETTVVGRAEAGGPVDAVTVLTGQWVSGPGEIVLYSDGRTEGFRPKVGDVFRVPDLPGSPTLTVVGTARSVSQTAGAWVSPDQLAALSAAGASSGRQMLYRFDAAGSSAEMAAARTAVESLLPAGALTGTKSWLTTRREASGSAALFVPFLVAFGVLGVLMATLIVGNVIAGAVSTGTRRIGILKALGFTPNQVVRAYVGQALMPATVGALLGVAAGVGLAVSVLAQTDKLYGTTDSSVIPWLDATVALAALALVALTAWAAALRAGRLRTVDALAVGRTPRPGRGQWAARFTGRLRLPRPVTLGLAHPFARPASAATVVAAIAFGAASVTFAVGLGSSLNRAQANDNHADVVIRAGRPENGPRPPGGPQIGPPGGTRIVTAPGGNRPTLEPAAVEKVITAQPATSGYCGVAETEVTAGGLTGAVETRALTGPGCAYGYLMVSGRWYTGPEEIVVATPFLTATGTDVGDSIVLSRSGKNVPVRIVGEVFNTDDDGMQVLTAVATLGAAEPELRPETYDVTVQPGTDLAAYTRGLNADLRTLDAFADTDERSTAEVVIIINALTTLLTVLLIAVAALAVLNMVVLETRERVHDLGVHKALGMTPRQTISMVIASVVVTGLIGGAIGAPAGVLVHRLVLGEMGRATGFNLPDFVIDIYQPAHLVLFGLGGLAIAVLGSLLPAGWAARTRTVTALRTE